MKIALMTWFHYDSYGTVLQAACLSRVLRAMGHSVDVIDYFPEGRFLYLPSPSAGREAVRALRARGRKRRDPRIITRTSGAAFEDFRRENLSFTHYCAALTDLERLNEQYDAFFCGSDRIWLPPHFDPHFYLDFVWDARRMIAYAPSIFDTGEVEEHIRAQMRTLIGRFRHLSVREEGGRRYLEDAFAESTQEVADPVLLIDPEEWDGTLQLPGSEEAPYLFAFFQGRNRSYHDAAVILADRLGLKLKVLPVFESDMEREGAVKGSVSPMQFVGLIRSAEYICTDSYHALLLSILFGKELCCFEQFTRREELALNTRVHHILKAVGLMERLYDIDAPLERYLEKTDYIPVRYKLDALKLTSREFLKASLEDVSSQGRPAPHIMEGSNDACASGQIKGPILHILEGYSLCSGCGTCADVCPKQAITIARDEKGFYRASVNEEMCVRCGACTDVCPFCGEAKGRPLAKGRLLYYRDEEQSLTEHASAGGLAGRLADLLLRSGVPVAACIGGEEEEVRHVLFVPGGEEEGAGHVLSAPGGEEAEVRHVLSVPGGEEAEGELPGMVQGSRYRQSNIALIWGRLREIDGPAALIGTPCQIAGAKRLFKDREDLIYIEIECGGVPSALLYEKCKVSRRRGHLLPLRPVKMALALRSRQLPGKGKDGLYIAGERGRRAPGRKDYLRRFLGSRECCMEACYDCRWRETSEADLRIGTWQGKEGYSSVVRLSGKGRELLEKLLLSGYWEGLHKADILEYLSRYPSRNPAKPVFYHDLISALADEKSSPGRLAAMYVRPFEKQERWAAAAWEEARRKAGTGRGKEQTWRQEHKQKEEAGENEGKDDAREGETKADEMEQ